MNKYDRNDLVRVSTVFLNSSSVATDPTTITFKFEKPDGTETTYVYPTDAQLVKDSTGNYHVDLTPDQSGTWSHYFKGTGAVQAVDEGQFFVLLSEF